MFDIRLRKVKDTVFDPLVAVVPQAITPGHLTGLGFLVGLLACVAAAGPRVAHLAFPLWLANRLLDCLDGATARRRGMTSDVGSFLDLSSDFVIYSAIPIAIGIGQTAVDGHETTHIYRWLGISLVEATFHVNNFMLFYCAAVAPQLQQDEVTSVKMRPALIEGFESGVLFSVMFLWPQYIGTLCWLMAVLVLVGVVQRFWYIVTLLSASSKTNAASKSRQE